MCRSSICCSKHHQEMPAGQFRAVFAADRLRLSPLHLASKRSRHSPACKAGVYFQSQRFASIRIYTQHGISRPQSTHHERSRAPTSGWPASKLAAAVPLARSFSVSLVAGPTLPCGTLGANVCGSRACHFGRAKPDDNITILMLAPQSKEPSCLKPLQVTTLRA